MHGPPASVESARPAGFGREQRRTLERVIALWREGGIEVVPVTLALLHLLTSVQPKGNEWRSELYDAWTPLHNPALQALQPTHHLHARGPAARSSSPPIIGYSPSTSSQFSSGMLPGQATRGDLRDGQTTRPRQLTAPHDLAHSATTDNLRAIVLAALAASSLDLAAMVGLAAPVRELRTTQNEQAVMVAAVLKRTEDSASGAAIAAGDQAGARAPARRLPPLAGPTAAASTHLRLRRRRSLQRWWRQMADLGGGLLAAPLPQPPVPIVQTSDVCTIYVETRGRESPYRPSRLRRAGGQNTRVQIALFSHKSRRGQAS